MGGENEGTCSVIRYSCSFYVDHCFLVMCPGPGLGSGEAGDIGKPAVPEKAAEQATPEKPATKTLPADLTANLEHNILFQIRLEGT